VDLFRLESLQRLEIYKVPAAGGHECRLRVPAAFQSPSLLMASICSIRVSVLDPVEDAFRRRSECETVGSSQGAPLCRDCQGIYFAAGEEPTLEISTLT